MSNFKNAAEIQRYLLAKEGNKLRYIGIPKGNIIGYKDGELYNFSDEAFTHRNFDRPEFWKKHVENEWAYSIPKHGRICKIHYRDYPVIIVDFDDEEDEDCQYQSEDDTFAEATPLTDKELLKFFSDKVFVKYGMQYYKNKGKGGE